MGGKPAIIFSVSAGVSIVGLTGGIIYTMVNNPVATKEVATKVIKKLTKPAA